MKKLLSMLLILSLVLGLCACGAASDNTAETAPAESQLLVGYGREKIMPETDVPLGGYGQTDTRISKQYIDYLYATCIAFKAGDETVLLFSMDLIGCYGNWVKNVREAVSQSLNIPGEKILFTASHTHSAPDMNSPDERIAAYKKLVTKQVIRAATAAIEDMTPSSLYGVKTKTDGLNFVREYILEDGRKGTGATFIASGKPVAHMEANDPEMILVKVDREGDKQDILMMNWQVHPVVTGGMKKYDISADIVASVRSTMELETDMLFAYYTGAAGNHNPSSEIEGEVSKSNNKMYPTKESLGEALADTALAALPNLQPIEGSGVVASQVMYELPYNHADEDKIADARAAVEIWKTEGHAAADKFAVEKGFHTIYHASAVISRTTRPTTGKIELDVIRVGGMGFAMAPYEMYAASGMYIKENSPFAYTMVLSCSNEAHGYFATMESYDVGTYGSTTSHFERGCAENTASKLVEMLESVK